jgi:hypothetical protein
MVKVLQATVSQPKDGAADQRSAPARDEPHICSAFFAINQFTNLGWRIKILFLSIFRISAEPQKTNLVNVLFDAGRIRS